MNVKEYLSKAYHIDKRIHSKIDQISSLRDLATKANATLSDSPPNATKNFKQMEGNIVKMVDLETEVNTEVDDLINLKKNIITIIKNVEDTELKILLELRYLCFKKWEEIASDLGYELRYLYKLHHKALMACNSVLKKDTKRAQKTLTDTKNL